MAKRVVLAGLLGGVALFLWGSLTHVVLDIGRIGIKEIPNEQPVIDAMRASIPDHGLYFFPGLHVSPDASREQRMAAMQEIARKAATGPSGILVYHPSGEGGLTPGRLLIELVLNVVQALLAATLLSWVTGVTGYFSRVAFVALAGVLASLSTNIQYWNWYGFPSNYTAAYVGNEIAGFLVVGLVVAAIVKSGVPARSVTVASA